MVEVITEIDDNRRIYLPASVRRAVPWKRFIVRAEGECIVLVPLKPAVDKYYGIAKSAVYTTAEEIDEAMIHETEKVLEEDMH